VKKLQHLKHPPLSSQQVTKPTCTRELKTLSVTTHDNGNLFEEAVNCFNSKYKCINDMGELQLEDRQRTARKQTTKTHAVYCSCYDVSKHGQRISFQLRHDLIEDVRKKRGKKPCFVFHAFSNHHQVDLIASHFKEIAIIINTPPFVSPFSTRPESTETTCTDTMDDYSDSILSSKPKQTYTNDLNVIKNSECVISCRPQEVLSQSTFASTTTTLSGCLCTMYLHDSSMVNRLTRCNDIEKTDVIPNSITSKLLLCTDNDTLYVSFHDNFTKSRNRNFHSSWSLSDSYDPDFWTQFTADATDDVNNYTFIKRSVLGSVTDKTSEIDWLLYDDSPPTARNTTTNNNHQTTHTFQEDYIRLQQQHHSNVLSLVPSPKKLTKFHRMLLPIRGRIINGKNKNITNTNNNIIAEATIQKSLFDLWLEKDVTQKQAITVLLRISCDLPNYQDPKRHILGPSLSSHQCQFTTPTRYYYQRLQFLILQTLQRCVCKFNYNNKIIQLGPGLQFSDIMVKDWFSELFEIQQTTSHTQAVYTLRNKLVTDYLDESKVLDVKQLQETSLDGCMVFSPDNGYSFVQYKFLCRQYNDVNFTFPRFFIPTISRPRFSRLSGFDSEDNNIQQLHDIFFTAAGTLNNRVQQNVLSSPKHNFITFTASDSRWQVPIKESVDIDSIWYQVQRLLERSSVIDSKHEKIDEISLIVGGTIQQVHHTDVGRQQSIWINTHPCTMQRRDKRRKGWEANRLYYNAEVGHRYSPSSILISLGSKGSVTRIGIQDNQIEWISPCAQFCRILNGNDNELFKIIQRVNNTVIVQCDTGCQFTADFQHCGVVHYDENVDRNVHYDEMFSVLHKISGLKQRDRDERALTTLRKVPRLDDLCRLHVSTKRINSQIVIPTNSVSFDECIH
jgi:hypothetical protein